MRPIAPDAIGGDPVTYSGKMHFDADVLDLMNKGYAFLHSIKVLKSPDAPENAYNPMPIETALKELGLSAPVGEIQGQPRDSNPFK